jgi:enoyl-CoA hydratase/carnithine racemase
MVNATVTDDLVSELRSHTLLLTLNRPAKLNAITRDMVAAWADALERARVDRGVRVVVVTGAGRAFCAGADLSMMPQTDDAGEVHGDDEMQHFAHRVAVAMDDLDKPVIAAVNGAAVGAGLGMALMADLRFLSDQARVCEGYINVGVFPGDADTYYLPRIVGTSKALELLWTGDFVDAQECLAMGLANRVFAPDELLPRTLEFADQLASRSQVAVRAIKRATYAGTNMNLRDSLGLISGLGSIANNSPERLRAFEEFMASRSSTAKERA